MVIPTENTLHLIPHKRELYSLRNEFMMELFRICCRGFVKEVFSARNKNGLWFCLVCSTLTRQNLGYAMY